MAAVNAVPAWRSVGVRLAVPLLHGGPVFAGKELRWIGVPGFAPCSPRARPAPSARRRPGADLAFPGLPGQLQLPADQGGQCSGVSGLVWRRKELIERSRLAAPPGRLEAAQRLFGDGA